MVSHTGKAPARDCPIVFSSPHSGRYYPDAFKSSLRVPLSDVRRLEDGRVDDLLRGVPASGPGVFNAVYARAYVDLNRHESELDCDMFADEATGLSAVAAERTTRVEAGFGCLPRLSGFGDPIYDAPLPAGEAEHRLATVWRPWHEALTRWLAAARQTSGMAVLIDCHSMPSIYCGRRMAPDIVLGDRRGASCDPLLMFAVHRYFERLGYRVDVNTPFAGGYITQRHGKPETGFHALQVEINRRLYLDESNISLTSGASRVRKDMAGLADCVVHTAERIKKSRARKRG